MSVLSIDSGEDVDLDELTLSVPDEVGSALLPSVDAELAAGVPVDESPTGLVVADGALVWEPLEAAAEELSGVLATGELDGDALVVLDDGAGFVGVVVGVSASRGIVAMGVSTAGFSAEAPGVVDGTVDEGVCGLESMKESPKMALTMEGPREWVYRRKNQLLMASVLLGSILLMLMALKALLLLLAAWMPLEIQSLERLSPSEFPSLEVPYLELWSVMQYPYLSGLSSEYLQE
ncbi:hypothetical protein PC118_g10358 [Phytophthora cactorum]|uniref:Uncharacterized protein n=1 Tax=Phytophthora cactorum TaxID=29920 RepID=A0A8T1FSQ1_9STRA|nr:hypothetical protein PC115_g8139 [Phytophthora cactorum]KAG2981847.1 hypothetical protein PC118_g10358 [Phytophthora cactorum]